MATNFPGSNDSFSVPANPTQTPLDSAGTGGNTRSHNIHHRDLGDAIVALQQNVPLLGHDHSGSGARATNKLVQANTHQSPDTDVDVTSLHHTLGTGQYQAAAGNDPRLSDDRRDAIMRAEYFASTGRTRRLFFHGVYTGGGYTQGAQDTFALTWGPLFDSENAFTYGGGNIVYYTIPADYPTNRRIGMALHFGTGNITGTLACKITRNGTNIGANSFATGAAYGNNGEAHANIYRPSLQLVPGDVIRWASWASANCTVGTVFSHPCEMIIWDNGPWPS